MQISHGRSKVDGYWYKTSRYAVYGNGFQSRHQSTCTFIAFSKYWSYFTFEYGIAYFLFQNSSVHSSTIKPNVSSSSTLYDTYNHSSVQENTSLSLNPVSESTSLDEDTEMINYDEYQNTLEHSDSFKSKHAPKNQKILIPPSSADEHRKLFENRRNVTHKWRSTDESIWAPTYAFKWCKSLL